MQTAYLVVQGSKFLVPAILKTSNHNYCINRSLKKGLFVNEYYNSLPAFEIIQALVGKRDYFWLCVILLLTSECSELLLQHIHTRGHSPNWGSMNAFIRDLRHSRFKIYIIFEVHKASFSLSCILLEYVHQISCPYQQ